MKQLLQYIRSGEAVVLDVPAPQVSPGMVLVQVANSLVSAGTERMVVDFAEKNLLQKARARPDLVRQTVEKAQREGILTTVDAVRNRLDQPMALGYSCAGTVIEVGKGVVHVKPGDKVACAGGGYAVHAEVVSVPKNLVVKLPESVPFTAAAFCTLGAIALQGMRLADTKLGEVVAVIGLGLLGQLTVQMLRASGCQVIGIDLQAQRAELALESGADAATTSETELIALVRQYSAGHGADAVLITADTKSNGPVELAGELAREQGVVVAVGAVGMNIPRKLYYEKEIDFRISRSYGPGRYDPEYEEKGQDYPYGYVRWTQQRNMGAFAQLVASGQLAIDKLISHNFSIDDAAQAYELITGKGNEPFLGVLLDYPQDGTIQHKVNLRQESARPATTNAVSLGIVGAGNFANATLLPAIKDIPGINLVGIASRAGVSSRTTADRFGFDFCTSDISEILSDDRVNTVAILTRHDQHADQVIGALKAGKHVFVEKPLCLTYEELVEIEETYDLQSSGNTAPLLMVGFNRRFAPFVVEMKEAVATISEPLLINIRANAGYIPLTHWTQDPDIGGGRLRGEGCHFIDLLLYLTGSTPTRVSTHSMADAGRYKQDNFIVTMEFANGSVGSVTYSANGDKSLGKEFIELFGGGLSARMDDYRNLVIRGENTRINRAARLRQDKGHRGEWEAIANYLTGNGPEPMGAADVFASTRATLAAYDSLIQKQSIDLS